MSQVREDGGGRGRGWRDLEGIESVLSGSGLDKGQTGCLSWFNLFI